MRYNKKNKNYVLKWFEETVCEAFSLYALNYFSEHWMDIRSGIMKLGYADSISKYVTDIVTEEAVFITEDPVHRLLDCRTKDDLEFVENYSECKRYLRFNERNYLYDLFKSQPYQIRLLLNYEQYVNKEWIMIDFDTWINDENGSTFIRSVSKIQPNIDR